MNAFNTVNLAAAVILTSTKLAKDFGIPESKWIYPIGGAGTSDASDCEFMQHIDMVHAENAKSGTDQALHLARPYPHLWTPD